METYDDFYRKKRKENLKFAVALALIFVSVFIALILLATCARADDIVAVTIAAEACGEGETGMQAVANTIQNRANSRNKTPEQIVTQKNQYYGATAANRHKLYSQCKAVADRLSKNIASLPDITGGAEYFLLPTEPVRRWHGDKTVKIGRHTFYKEAK